MAGIFGSPMFAPQTYGGQGAGLLELLKSLQTQPQAGTFGQNPTGHDVNPWSAAGPLGNGQGPAESALPPNAQPTQGGPLPAAQPPQAAEPGMGERLLAGFQGFAGGGGLLPALSGAATGLATGNPNPNGNMTQRALQAKGFDADLAKVVASDPGLLRAVLPNLLGTAGQTDDIKEYQFAKREEPNLTFQQFMQRKRAVSGEFGLTPIWGTGPDGKPAYIQPGKSGEARLAKMPEGFQIARDPIKMDAGDSWVLLDPQTRQPVRTVPKNLEAKEAAEARGKIQGEAQGVLPAEELAASRSTAKIDELLNDKGFNQVFGVLDQYRPNFTMSDDGRRALTRFNQMEGTAFLEGRQMLKGGGAITDFESKKAEGAIARLSRSLSESDAREALKDFKDAVNAGLEKLRAKAKGGAVAAPASAPPQRIRLNADGTIAQ
jgi:hypothetical protein